MLLPLSRGHNGARGGKSYEGSGSFWIVQKGQPGNPSGELVGGGVGGTFVEGLEGKPKPVWQCQPNTCYNVNIIQCPSVLVQKTQARGYNYQSHKNQLPYQQLSSPTDSLSTHSSREVGTFGPGMVTLCQVGRCTGMVIGQNQQGLARLCPHSWQGKLGPSASSLPEVSLAPSGLEPFPSPLLSVHTPLLPTFRRNHLQGLTMKFANLLQ